MPDNLLDIFNARNGIVSCVGAGGKKSIMFRLAEAHSGRVGITATAHIQFFPKSLNATNYIADEDELFKAIKNDRTSSKIAFAKPSERFGRRAGISIESVEKFKEAGNFELLVIKADGARERFIKAPAEHEPVIAPCTDNVITVLSGKVIGLPLSDEIAHRVEKISEVCELKEGNKIEPIHIARLMTSSFGLLKNIDNFNIIPLINMVEDSEIERNARAAAYEALQMTDQFDKVVLGSMKQEECIIDVVTR